MQLQMSPGFMLQSWFSPRKYPDPLRVFFQSSLGANFPKATAGSDKWMTADGQLLHPCTCRCSEMAKGVAGGANRHTRGTRGLTPLTSPATELNFYLIRKCKALCHSRTSIHYVGIPGYCVSSGYKVPTTECLDLVPRCQFIFGGTTVSDCGRKGMPLLLQPVTDICLSETCQQQMHIETHAALLSILLTWSFNMC